MRDVVGCRVFGKCGMDVATLAETTYVMATQTTDHIRRTAKELQPGQRFKTNTAQRIWKTVTNVQPLGDGPNIPDTFKGKLLVIHNPGGSRGKGKYAACSQLVLDPSDFVYVIPTGVTGIRPMPTVPGILKGTWTAVGGWCVSGAGLVGAAMCSSALDKFTGWTNGNRVCGSLLYNDKWCWFIRLSYVENESYYHNDDDLPF